MHRPRISILCVLVLCLAPAMPSAAQTQRNAPIQLDADHADLDASTGVGVYTGDVVLTQGERTITGDRMTVYTRDGRVLDRVVVEGSPATWRQPSETGDEIVGEAPRMEYHAGDPERVRLLEGGQVTRGRNVFTGETIEYNLSTQRVQARGEESGNRIRITLFPPEESGQ